MKKQLIFLTLTLLSYSILFGQDSANTLNVSVRSSSSQGSRILVNSDLQQRNVETQQETVTELRQRLNEQTRNDFNASIRSQSENLDDQLGLTRAIGYASKKTTLLMPPIMGSFGEDIIDHAQSSAEQRFRENTLKGLQMRVDHMDINPNLTNSEKIKLVESAIYDNVDADNRAISNQIVTQYATRIVADNSDQINNIIDKTERITYNQATLKQEFNASFENLERRIVNNTFEIRELAGSIDFLLEEDMRIFAELDELHGQVTQNTALIQQNSDQIARNKAAIQFNSGRIEDNRSKILENRELIEKNQNLISQNAHDIKTINGYLLGTLDTRAELQALRNGDLGTDKWPESERESRIQKLERMASVDCMMNLRNDINVAVASGMTIAQAFGLLESENGKKVAGFLNKGMDIGNNGVGLAAAIMTGDVMGMISNGANLLGSIFGLPPSKSAELQAIEAVDAKLDAMRDENRAYFNEILDGQMALRQGQVDIQNTIIKLGERIDVHFSNVYDRFNDVEHRIADLSLSVEKLRQDNLEKAYQIMQELEIIDDKIDYVQGTLELLLNADYYTCINGSININVDTISTLTSLRKSYTRSLANCVRGIGTIVDARTERRFQAQLYRNESNDQFLQREEENYQNLKGLIGNLDAYGQQELLKVLLNPVTELNYNRWRSTRNDATNRYQSNININDVFNSDMLNPIMIESVCRQYLKYLIFFEFHDYDGLYSIDDIIEGHANLEGNRQEILDGLTFLTKMVDIAIVQQSLLSGEGVLPILDEIRIDGASNQSYRLLYEILEYNPTVKRNLELYLFTRDFRYNRSIDTSLMNVITAVNTAEEAWSVKYLERAYPALWGKLLRPSEHISFERKMDFPAEDPDAIYDFSYFNFDDIKNGNLQSQQPEIRLKTLHTHTSHGPRVRNGFGYRVGNLLPTHIEGISYEILLFDSPYEIDQKFGLSNIEVTYNQCRQNAEGVSAKGRCNQSRRREYSRINGEIIAFDKPYSFTPFTITDFQNPTMLYPPIIDELIDIREKLLTKKAEFEINSELIRDGLGEDDLRAIYISQW